MLVKELSSEKKIVS